MVHTNKGIIGARFDLIDDVLISNLIIKDLHNSSPLASYSCSNYSGPGDGGNNHQLQLQGSMSADVAGMTVYGGDISFVDGINKIKHLMSDNGGVRGIHLMDDHRHYTILYIADFVDLRISHLFGGDMVTQQLLTDLIKYNKDPYPNNFYECNILIDETNDND
eukprot:395922_1